MWSLYTFQMRYFEGDGSRNWVSSASVSFLS
jgi:hypothetical protein